MSEPLPQKIVDAVADANGVDPTELEYSLSDRVDLEALAQLANNSTATWTVSFELPDHHVIVTSDGSIHVDSTQLNVST